MNQQAPPEALPGGFRDIWRALNAADVEAASRRALAGRLGVSTHTLQRILVDGDVPDLASGGSLRVRHAWARILTRLALHLGHEPRQWIEQVGMAWDAATAEVSRAAARAVRDDRAAGQGGGGTSSGAQEETAAVRSFASPGRWPDEIRCGIVESIAGTGPLAPMRRVFLREFTRRLIGSVAPRSKFLAVELSDRLAARDPLPGSAMVEITAGLLRTPRQRQPGVELLAVPGWRTPLTAIGARRSAGSPPFPTWLIATAPGGPRSHRFLVIEDDVAHDYLRGQCAMPDDRLVLRSKADATELANSMAAEVRRHPERPIILLATRGLAGRVAAILQSIEAVGEGCVVEELDGAAAECPRYPLAIALAPSVRHCAPPVELGLEEELFGSASRDTARLYATLVALEAVGHLADGPRPPADRRDLDWELVADPLMSGAFIAAFCAHLASEIDSGLTARSAAHWGEGGATRAERREALVEERALAFELARRLLPDTWHEPLETARVAHEHAAVPRVAAGPHCQSCSVSLLEPAHRGASDRFCRFCSDDAGRLKPRREVQRLIAEWMRHWQGELSHREAMHRAALYMQAMPAWSEN